MKLTECFLSADERLHQSPQRSASEQRGRPPQRSQVSYRWNLIEFSPYSPAWNGIVAPVVGFHCKKREGCEVKDIGACSWAADAPPVTHSPAGSAVSSVIRVGCGSLSRMPDCLWHLVPPSQSPKCFLAASPKAHSCSRWWAVTVVTSHLYRGPRLGGTSRSHGVRLRFGGFISDLTEDDKHIVVEWNCESNLESIFIQALYTYKSNFEVLFLSTLSFYSTTCYGRILYFLLYYIFRVDTTFLVLDLNIVSFHFWLV